MARADAKKKNPALLIIIQW